jgi:choline dehydrogenase-like flavoprotein
MTGRKQDHEFDYIIVGGGSAGCTLAGRLTEDPHISVLLLEEGPRDWNPYIHLPVTYYKTAKGPLLTRYRYANREAQPEVSDPTMIQARVLGGGSSVNAMLYVRGNPADYDGWEAAGAEGWSYRDVLPYFKRAEGNNLFANDAHSAEGPLKISDPQAIHSLTRRWLQACQQAGLPYNPDFNSGVQAGCGTYQITACDGRRSSAAVAYLREAKRRPNLSIWTGSHVLKVVIEDGRATGVEFVRGGDRSVVQARREIILTAGALSTPKLLMCSGVGPARHLQENGIEVKKDLPGVGRNYQDHMEMSLVYQLNGPHSYDKYKSLRWQFMAGLQYILFRGGPIVSNIIESGAFWWSSNKEELPDIQIFFLAGAGVEEGVDSVPSGNGCTISVTQTRPRSQGFVELGGPDPMDPPLIAPRYLSDPYDVKCLMDGALLVQEIMRQPALRPYLTKSHVPPSDLVSEEELERFVRANAHAGLHPCGTCRIGNDPMSVVDPELRVHGVSGLRIADASVMPAVISGNLNAVVIMIAEKAADIIRGKKLPFSASGPMKLAHQLASHVTRSHP